MIIDVWIMEDEINQASLTTYYKRGTYSLPVFASMIDLRKDISHTPFVEIR